jgi:L-lysine 6-transaminase
VTISTLTKIQPADVHGVLSRHMLADGFDLVFDYEKSHGSWLHDARSGREYLDFITFTASNPIGYNHPGMKDAEFLKVLYRVAQLKPALSDLYSVEYAQFVETFGRLAIPASMKYVFFVEGGTLGVENALKAAFDWKVRRNKAKGIAGERGSQVIHFREAFHGRSGYTLSLTNTDPVKTDYFPKFRWPRIDNPKMRFPMTPEAERDVAAAEQRALDQIRRAFADNPDDIAAILIEPIQGEGGDNHFRPEFMQALERTARENACFFIVDEVQTGVGDHGEDVGPRALRRHARRHVLRQEDAGLRLPGGAQGGREPQNVFKVPSRINSTWGGGLTDMVRFGRYLEVIHEERLVENARVVGEHLLAGLRELQRERGGLRFERARPRPVDRVRPAHAGDARQGQGRDLAERAAGPALRAAVGALPSAAEPVRGRGRRGLDIVRRSLEQL